MYMYGFQSGFIRSPLCQRWLSEDLAATALDYVETTDRPIPRHFCPLVCLVSPFVVLCKYQSNSRGLPVQKTQYTRGYTFVTVAFKAGG